jgi:hypothetical protein
VALRPGRVRAAFESICPQIAVTATIAVAVRPAYVFRCVLPKELPMVVHNAMTSQDRIRLAQRLHKRAKDPARSPKERSIALDHIRNLMRINMAVAVRELSETPSPNQPPKAA